MEPDPLGQPAHDQGDARAADRLPLPVPRSRTNDARALPGLALAGAGGRGLARRPPARCPALPAARPLRRARDRAREHSRTCPRPPLPASGSLPGRCSSSASSCSASISSSPTSSRSASRRSLVVVAVVAITFFGTRWAGRRLGVSDDLSLLVATGFSICGVSAIAAANGVIDADEDEVAFAVALVTLCGTLAIVTCRRCAARSASTTSSSAPGSARASTTSAQVVATSSTAGSVALATAVVVKLTRVMLLAPLDRRASPSSAPARPDAPTRRRDRRSCRPSSSLFVADGRRSRASASSPTA